MSLSRTKLYLLIFFACLAGYIWLFYNMNNKESGISHSVEVCMIRHVTNIPCPSCGSTRAILSLAHGRFIESLAINPVGLVLAIIMIICPFWLFADIITKKSTLQNFYHRIHVLLKKPGVYIPLVLLMVTNWIWNITKGI